ncbi:peptidyl-tRNA hydrolase 2, mitochondrial [Cimex lectularius]|uniref:peptidyl-tRNA hydrolase n=1 Tax=Cimex lectularius TaxID=79782 RepID=A0A8I6RPJ2_CIMLE|nr:peptidyl-tRNA hydrolase 2, mitochondrial [Cimex lectularius]
MYQYNLSVQDVLVGFTVGLLTGIFVPKLFNSKNIKTLATTASSWKQYRDVKMVIVVRSDLLMGKGKIAAQCSHATLSAYKEALKLNPDMVKAWEKSGQTKIVLKLPNEGEESTENALYKLKTNANNLGVVASVIHDAGRTQIASGTATAVAVGPAQSKTVDLVTGHLKLL